MDNHPIAHSPATPRPSDDDDLMASLGLVAMPDSPLSCIPVSFSSTSSVVTDAVSRVLVRLRPCGRRMPVPMNVAQKRF